MYSKAWRRLFGIVIAVLFVFNLFLPAPGAANHPSGSVQAQPSTPPEPVVVEAVKNDQSAPLRDLDLSGEISGFGQDPTGGDIREAGTLPLLKDNAPVLSASADLDPVVQSQPGEAAAMPAPIMSFDGIGNVNTVVPPDTQGDIGYDPATGKKYYVQWINLSFAVWDVTDGVSGTQTKVLGPLPGNSLWEGFGGDCETRNDGDPITLYDPIARRWFMSQFSFGEPFYQCIAISKTGDPTGEWYRYAFEWKNSLGNPVMNDYPKFGVWPDAYYMTTNQFTLSLDWAGTGVAASSVGTSVGASGGRGVSGTAV